LLRPITEAIGRENIHLAFDEAVMCAQALDAHDRTRVDAEQQDRRGSNTSE
jgi:hypothetical protein